VRGLAGKTAIVTGAGNGIGRAVAIRLADEGVSVCIADLDVGATADAVDEITTTGGTAIGIVADVSDAARCAHVVDETVRRFGSLHILVNNAGSEARDRSAAPLERWDLGIDKTLSSVYRMSAAGLPRLRATGNGAIVNISSIIGTRTWGIEEWYATAKAAITGLTRAHAGAHGRAGVRVNAVCPGLIRTGRTTTLTEDELKAARALTHQAIDRFGEPADVAGLVAFLASDDAAFITGEIVTVDGGWSIN
jgi:NAD(P)-dependent dehydrogenase (short-subunit alcohol dehydrogenase family)